MQRHRRRKSSLLIPGDLLVTERISGLSTSSRFGSVSVNPVRASIFSTQAADARQDERPGTRWWVPSSVTG
ncbi:MAG: hypothetical protein ACRDPW_09985 [Mycobacteriales bacterium]